MTGCSIEEKAVENSGIFGPPHTRIVEITATVNNREHVEQYQVIAQKKEEQPKSPVFDKDNDKVSTEDEDKTIISLPKEDYFKGPFKEWSIAISVRPDDAGYSDTIPCSKAGETPRCKIEQPKDGEEKDQDKVEFRAVLEHCDGCSYVVEFDGSNKKHDNCSQDKCEISISKDEFTSLNVGDEYLFTLSSPNDEFEPCSSKVKIKAAPGQLGLSECSATGVGTVVTLTTKSEGCGPAESCSYSIEPGGTDGSGTYSDNQIITFFYGGDAKEHTLTVTKGSGTNAQTASCKFSVTYSSSSSSETSSSSVASSSSEESSSSVESSSSEESSSSVESSSSEESSSSVASSSSVVSSSSVAGETIMGDQELKDGYPAKKSYPSGTCFTITGTWTNQYYFASPKMQCNGRHITITYNGSEICSTVGSDNGTCTSSTLGTFTYQSSTTVFFEHICVTSQEGTNVECGLTN